MPVSAFIPFPHQHLIIPLQELAGELASDLANHGPGKQHSRIFQERKPDRKQTQTIDIYYILCRDCGHPYKRRNARNGGGIYAACYTSNSLNTGKGRRNLYSCPYISRHKKALEKGSGKLCFLSQRIPVHCSFILYFLYTGTQI